MIKKENKLIQITLDPESQELLYSLADRFHISKTEVIKQALKVFGSTKNHHYTTYLNQKPIKKSNQQENKNYDEEWEEIMKELGKEQSSQ